VLLGTPEGRLREQHIANDLTAGSTRFTTKTGEYVQISGCDFAKG